MKGITKRRTLIASGILIVLALIITACSFNFITARAEEAEETDVVPIIFDESYFSRANTYNAHITENCYRKG